ncbi:GspE/PulE family protein [soil metagenome]
MIEAEPPILVILARAGRLNPERLASARGIVARGGGSPERSLVRAGLVTEQEIAEIYAEEFGLPMVDRETELPPIDPVLRRLVPEKLCTGHFLAPWVVRNNTLEVVFASPMDLDLVDALQFLTSMSIRPMIAPLSVVERRLEAVYHSGHDIVGDVSEFLIEAISEEESDEDILNLDLAPPPDENGRIIRMVNQILDQALRTGASDIHLEPFEESCKFRLRIDGLLHELPSPSKAAFLMIVSRLKILAKLDIAEKRIPQDGAVSVKAGDRRVDLRVSTVPTTYGEKMVLRILDKGAIPLELTRLGLDKRQSNDLLEAIKMPHGLALVTGPTGSGKSTTLYSCLNLLNESKTNICTVEDPVEYKFRGLNQVQVKPLVGLTFASALRAFLRQDPDIIMVGEVRDQETAEICLRAALTGHFVLSTLHTNDALSAISRLQDMGIEPFLLASTLRVLQAQRLVRKLCPHCKEAYEPDHETARRQGLEPGETIYRPVGCPQCRKVGYRGRVGIFEVIRITPELSHLIQSQASLTNLRQAAQAAGMKTLFESALAKVREGITSLEAALSVTMLGEH